MAPLVGWLGSQAKYQIKHPHHQRDYFWGRTWVFEGSEKPGESPYGLDVLYICCYFELHMKRREALKPSAPPGPSGREKEGVESAGWHGHLLLSRHCPLPFTVSVFWLSSSSCPGDTLLRVEPPEGQAGTQWYFSAICSRTLGGIPVFTWFHDQSWQDWGENPVLLFSSASGSLFGLVFLNKWHLWFLLCRLPALCTCQPHRFPRFRFSLST